MLILIYIKFIWSIFLIRFELEKYFMVRRIFMLNKNNIIMLINFVYFII